MNLNRLHILILLSCVLQPILSLGQSLNSFKGSDSLISNSFTGHQEKRTSNTLTKKNTSGITSAAYRYISGDLMTVQVNVNENGENIVNDAANEPSLAINPLNPDQMVIGWRQFDTISDNFRQAGYAYTSDGGNNWTFPGVIEPGIFRSDPVLDYDSKGLFYYNSLSQDANNNFICHIFVSEDGGVTWTDKREANGGDKQWMTIDKTSGASNGFIYEMWTYAFGLCNPMSFVRSTDNGITFDDCIMVPEQLYWGTLAVDRTGTLYLGGINSLSWTANNSTFVVARSTSAKDANSLVTWENSVRVNLDGSLGYGVYPNPGGLSGQTWISTDTSGGEYDGYVYLLASVERASINDLLDVMFSRSSDGGITWIDPVRVNDDLTTDAFQWFGTMSVSPDGRIDAAWLDTRDDTTGGLMSSLYYSYSTDAGDTWAPNIKLSELFYSHLGWPSQNKMGDYMHMISDEYGVNLAWTNTLNGGQDVYFSRINIPLVGVKEEIDNSVENFTLFQNFPNPFNSSTTISYRLIQPGQVKLEVYSTLGEKVATLVDMEQQKGIFTISFDATNFTSGVYYYTLTSGNYKQSRKLILLK